MPDKNKGPLPFYVYIDGINIINNYSVVLNKPLGMRVNLYNGKDSWTINNSQLLFINFLYPLRIYIPFLQYPFSAEFTGKITPDINGNFQFENEPTMKCKIFIDNIFEEKTGIIFKNPIKLNAHNKYDINYYKLLLCMGWHGFKYYDALL